MTVKQAHLTAVAFSVSFLFIGAVIGGVVGTLTASDSHAALQPSVIDRTSSFTEAEKHFDFSKPSAQGLALVDGIDGPANCWNWQGKGWFASWCEHRSVRQAPPIERPANE